MSFVQTATWAYRSPASGRARRRAGSPARPRTHTDRYRRRVAALAATAVVHLLLLIVLAMKVDVQTVQPSGEPGSALSVFDLSDPAAADAPQQEAMVKASAPPPAPLVPVAPVTPPREWQTVRVALIASPAGASAQAPGPASMLASAGSAPQTSTTSPGGGFDPYAGAAVRPVDARSGPASPPAPGQATDAGRMSEVALRATLTACLRGTHETSAQIPLVIAVLADGTVFDVAAVEPAQAELAKRCARDVSGKRLASSPVSAKPRELRWRL